MSALKPLSLPAHEQKAAEKWINERGITGEETLRRAAILRGEGRHLSLVRGPQTREEQIREYVQAQRLSAASHGGKTWTGRHAIRAHFDALEERLLAAWRLELELDRLADDGAPAPTPYAASLPRRVALGVAR